MIYSLLNLHADLEYLQYMRECRMSLSGSGSLILYQLLLIATQFAIQECREEGSGTSYKI